MLNAGNVRTARKAGSRASRPLRGVGSRENMRPMSSDVAPDVSALAINVTIPERFRWTGTRRGCRRHALNRAKYARA